MPIIISNKIDFPKTIIVQDFKITLLAFQVIIFSNVASGTVYKTLDSFVDKGIIRRVKTNRDEMRYDSITKTHHHLYDWLIDIIEDYFEEDLNDVLRNYFEKKSIPDFHIQEIILQIKGRFV